MKRMKLIMTRSNLDKTQFSKKSRLSSFQFQQKNVKYVNYFLQTQVKKESFLDGNQQVMIQRHDFENSIKNKFQYNLTFSKKKRFVSSTSEKKRYFLRKKKPIYHKPLIFRKSLFCY